ncbi:MAG: hypothetical protein V4757_02970 [Pseudomonadota bacterium]
MSRHINIQLQKLRSPDAPYYVETLLHVIHASRSKSLEISIDWSEASYCNIVIRVGKSTVFWRRLFHAILNEAAIHAWVKNRWIVVIEGPAGWNDYLLLAHFDPTVETDDLVGT